MKLSLLRKQYDCTIEHSVSCIWRNVHTLMITENRRQLTLLTTMLSLLSETSNLRRMKVSAKSWRQRRAAREIKRHGCSSTRARRHCSMTLTRKSRRERNRTTTWLSILRAFHPSRESEYRYRTRACFQIPATTERRVSPRMIVIGWDKFRSRLMLFLIGCLLIWVCIFFPLLGSWKLPCSVVTDDTLIKTLNRSHTIRNDDIQYTHTWHSHFYVYIYIKYYVK